MTQPNSWFLQHGWGGDPYCWSEWIGLFPKNISLSYGNRGYFGSPQPSFVQDSGSIGIVSHSFGLHLLSEDLIKRCTSLVVIAGFYTIFNDTVISQNVAMNAMREGLQKSPQHVLEQFYATCGGLPSYYSKDYLQRAKSEILCEDLTLMQTSKPSIASLKTIPKILLLQGEKDPIVSRSQAEVLQQKLPQSQLILIEQGAHGLPWTDAKRCWREIEENLPWN